MFLMANVAFNSSDIERQSDMFNRQSVPIHWDVSWYLALFCITLTDNVQLKHLLCSISPKDVKFIEAWETVHPSCSVTNGTEHFVTIFHLFTL